MGRLTEVAAIFGSTGDELAIEVGLALFYVGLALAILGLVLAARSRRRRIRRIANELGGRASVEYDGTHQIEFQIDGIGCALTFSGSVRYTAPFTRIAFDWRPEGRLLISPQGTGVGTSEPAGLLPIRTGDETFDSALWARGGPPRWAEKVLTAAARPRLLSLSRLGLNAFQDPDVRFYAGPAGVRILCPRDLLGKRDALRRSSISAPNSFGSFADRNGNPRSSSGLPELERTVSAPSVPASSRAICTYALDAQCRTIGHAGNMWEGAGSLHAAG